MKVKPVTEQVEMLVQLALKGDRQALELLLQSVQDVVFNLSLRMLGTVADAEDAAQEILIRIMTNLSTFRNESRFQTWVYRLAVNYLINYKKSMFSQHPLDFEIYGNDIKYAAIDEAEELVEKLSKETLAEELKLSCTNVMLQCLDPQNRTIFILGTMFKMDSRQAAEILAITPENYRQKLSRIRKKIAGFLANYCGLTESGLCSCINRVNYAAAQNRINPRKPEFLSLKQLDRQVLMESKQEMERLDDLALIFEDLPDYQTPDSIRQMITEVLRSPLLRTTEEVWGRQ